MKKFIKIIIAIISIILIVGVPSYILFSDESYTVTYENYNKGTKPSDLEDVYELPDSLPVLEENGYEFGGWFFDDGFIVEAFPNDLIVEDTTLYAYWIKEVYNVTFNNNGHGENLAKISNIYKLPELPELEESGYSFLGWYYDSSFNQQAKANDEIYNDTTLYAKWEENGFTLSFNNNGYGNPINSILNVVEINNLPTLTTEGYNFLGWYYDEEFKNEVKIGDILTKDVTLYAKWEPIEYKIYFFSHLDEPEIFNLKYDQEFTIITPLKYSGHTFIEWNTKADGTGQSYQPNQIVKNLSTKEDVELYAIWEVNEYTVTFNLNNGENNVVKTLYYNDLIHKIENPEKEGYKFDGWYLNDEKIDLDNTYMPSENIIITAKYLKEVDIIFVSSNTIYDKITGYETEEIKESILNPTLVGYNFLGWYLDDDFKEEYNLTVFPDNDVNVYAKWEAIEYTISFDLNGAEGETKTLKAIYDQNAYILSCEATLTGYTFKGWNTKADGTGETYFVNQNIKNIFINDVTLYAIWEQTEYTITIKLNNGEEDIVKTLHYNDLIENVENPTKDNSEFVGWYTYLGDKIIEFSFVDARMPDNNIVVFAKYSDEVVILFIVDNKAYQTIYGYENEAIIELIIDPEKEGYTFKGWYLDTNFEQEYNLTIFPTEDINVYAKWETNTVTIHFDGNGSTFGIMSEQNIVYGTNTILNKNVFVKTGSEFLGWSENKNSTKATYSDQYNQDIISEGEITLYAIWKQIEYTLTIILNNGEDDIVRKLYYNESIEVLINPTKNGYAFKGWYLDNNEEFDFIDAKMPDSNLIIHAEYLKGVEIVFVLNGAVVDTIKGYETEEISNTLPIPTKEGYTFKGWYLDSTFEQEYNLEFFPSENINVYGKLEENVVTIKFNGNGNTSGTMDNQSIVYGSGTALSKNTFVKTGHTFIGWSTNKDATTATYSDQYNKDIIFEGEITLYAVWQKITYKVSFNNNNHGQTPSSIQGVTQLPDTLPLLIEEGYIFIGWYYDSNFQTPANVNDVLTSNVTLYAKWEEEKVEPTPTEPIVDDIIYDDFQIHFLELGNDYTGDSIYIKAGDVDILIDAGSRTNSATTIKSYVDQYCTDGVLEYVIVTHADQDHISGFVGNASGSTKTGILYQYEVEVIIDFALTTKTTQIYNNYVTARNYAISNGATHYTAAQCFNETDGAKSEYQLTNNISMKILYNYYYFNSSSDENNFSVCTLFTYNKHYFMFTGDLEEAGEERLAAYYDGSTTAKTLPQVDLYKAGHHGSKTSSNDCLLKLIQPKMVCVCCCAGGSEYTPYYQNTFPTQDTINRIAKYTDRVYVTSVYDEKELTRKSMNGNIIISCNGQTIGVSATNNIIKLKDTTWFNETVYIDSSGKYCSGTGKKDYYTSATSGVNGVPRRVWPS